MQLPYLAETITNPDGIECAVLDGARVNFNDASCRGRKKAETLVREAQGGEEIVTRNKAGQVESTYVAQAGDAIFVNMHNPDDVYVPGNPDGSRWKFSELQQKGYDIVSGHPLATTTSVIVKSAQTFRLLPDAVEKPTCIRDAWGAGQHQFLFAGAALKLNDDGHITGIDREAFNATWETLSL